MNVVTKAIDEHGLKPLAVLMGVSYQAIRKWESANNGAGKVPAERVPSFSEKTGIERHQVRPDLYEAPVEAA